MSESTPTLDRPASNDAEKDMTKKHTANFAHRLYTGEFEFSFVARRKLWYLISLVLIVVSFGSLFIRGLNLGIEFQGGSVFTVPVSSTSDEVKERVIQGLRDASVEGVAGAPVTAVGGESLRVQTKTLTPTEVTQVRTSLASAVDKSGEDVGYTSIGASWGEQITDKALQALVVFLVLVALMIWAFFREWRMAISAIVGLIHDLIVTVGLYALIGFAVTPSTMIGVLTILGYSLYDNVVVFDKVRENTVDIQKQKRTFSEAANAAVNQVLVRSINTTVIGVLPVVALLIAGIVFLGGDGPLADLGLALLIGMIAGAYSSIFIATPLLCQLREREPDMKKHVAALKRRREREAAELEISISAADAEPVTSPASVREANSARVSQTESSTKKSRRMREVSDGRTQPIRDSRSKRKN